jgi:hypothetical protein
MVVVDSLVVLIGTELRSMPKKRKFFYTHFISTHFIRTVLVLIDEVSISEG